MYRALCVLTHKLLMESRVNPTSCEQRVMCAALDDAAMLKDEHQVSTANSAEAMGDDESSAAAEKQFQRALEPGFSNAVDGTGGFVEDDDAGVWKQRTGKANELALT